MSDCQDTLIMSLGECPRYLDYFSPFPCLPLASKFALITFEESKLHCSSSTWGLRENELRVGLDSGSRVVGRLGNEMCQGLARFLPRMSGRATGCTLAQGHTRAGGRRQDGHVPPHS